MDIDQVLGLGDELEEFLNEFRPCFKRAEPRMHMASYVQCQLREMDRKSVEPMALASRIAPRTLQEFLRTDVWDHEGMRDRAQRIVSRDHDAVDNIAILDDSGHPKKGTETACVSRQYCGRTGKVDNCVVTVHLTLASFDTSFRTLLDSVPYLPESWDTPERREKAKIPKTVVYRPKYEIALEQLDRARANGITFGWVLADTWYSHKRKFLGGLLKRNERFVLEIPRDFCGWTSDPRQGPARPAKQVRNLAWHSRPMKDQLWTNLYVKDTEKGPDVWRVRCLPFWCEIDDQIHGPWWLIWAQNAANPAEEKFILSNASPGTPLEVILYVGCSRWPIERSLQDEKSELGMSHFEVRNYQSLCRHLLLTNTSHLFAARQAKRLAGEKSRDHYSSNPSRDRRADFNSTSPSRATTRAPHEISRNPELPPRAQCLRTDITHENIQTPLGTKRRRPHQNPLLSPTNE
jgi:SRSO17 transposase